MYLISLYFDTDTEEKIKTYMKETVKRTGNDAMIAGNVPPHVTISAFHSYKEETALEIFRSVTTKVSAGRFYCASIGTFLPSVVFASPVINEYLQGAITTIYKEVICKEGVAADERYRPFCWMPHITIGKNLTKEQMQKAFAALQNQFAPFEGKVVKIGLAKTNPYTDLESYVFK